MSDKIILELTVSETKVLIRIMQSNTPAIEDEMIVLMLYNRILSKLKEKNE